MVRKTPKLAVSLNCRPLASTRSMYGTPGATIGGGLVFVPSDNCPSASSARPRQWAISSRNVLTASVVSNRVHCSGLGPRKCFWCRHHSSPGIRLHPTVFVCHVGRVSQWHRRTCSLKVSPGRKSAHLTIVHCSTEFPPFGHAQWVAAVETMLGSGGWHSQQDCHCAVLAVRPGHRADRLYGGVVQVLRD